MGRAGTLTVLAGTKALVIAGGTYDIIAVTAHVVTMPTVTNLIVDVDKNGATIFGTQSARPTWTPGGSNVATVGTPTVTSVTSGDLITIDVDQIGTVAGADLTLTLWLRKQ